MHSEFKFASPGMGLCLLRWEGLFFSSLSLGPLSFALTVSSELGLYTRRSRDGGTAGTRQPVALRVLRYLGSWPVILEVQHGPASTRLPSCFSFMDPKGRIFPSFLAVSQDWCHHFSLLLPHPWRDYTLLLRILKICLLSFLNYLCEGKEDKEEKAPSLSTSMPGFSPFSAFSPVA